MNAFAETAAPGTAATLVEVFRHLSAKNVLRLLATRSFSVNSFYLLYFNLGKRVVPVPARLGGGVLERIKPSDLDFLYAQLFSAGHEDQRELLARILFYRHGLQNCYVLREGGALAYLQWIIYPSENGVLQAKYRGHYLPLQNHQVMLENAFTLEPFRGRGFHPYATAELLNRARAEGYQAAVSYIKTRNISSLNNFISMGFKIHKLIREYRLLGRVWKRR